MKKFTRLLSVLLTFILTLGLFVPFSTTVSAEGAMPNYKNGVYEIETYEQLRNVAAIAYYGVNAKLINDITSTDNSNDAYIKVQPAGNMTLDLNGYTLFRSAYSLDKALISVETDANVTIYDSSKNQTGTCRYYCHAGIQAGSVIANRGGTLTIKSGNYIFESEGSTSCGVIVAESGTTYIKGGYFDGSGAYAAAIKMPHWGFMYDTPFVYVSGGVFYSSTGICISPYGNYLKYGSFFPAAFVLGGEFHLTDHKGDGFAYCNNAWGNIYVGGGLIPAYSLNGSRDYTFGDGCITNLVKRQNPEGTDDTYYEVTRPNMIYTQLDTDELLLQRLNRQWLSKYQKHSALTENHAELFESAALPRMIYVDRKQTNPFTLTVIPYQEDATHKWLTADSSDGPWTNLSQYENADCTVSRPAEATTKYYRLEVTSVKGNVYTDDVMFVFEAAQKTTVLSKIDFHINAPEDGQKPTSEIYVSPTTMGGYTPTKVEWFDKTTNKTMSATESFVASHLYEARITLAAEEDFAFSVIPLLQATCNYQKATVETLDNEAPTKTIRIIYDAGICSTAIATTTLSICPPVAGKERDLYPEVGKQNFTVDSVTWYDRTEDRAMEKGELFVNGHHYTVQVWLQANDGFSFANNNEIPLVKGTVNGKTAPVVSAYEQSLDEMVELNYDFGVCDSIINQVNVMDLYKPQPGDNPVGYALTHSEQYVVGSVFWYGPDGQLLWDSDHFEEGVTYEAAVQLLSVKHGTTYLYSFADDLRAFVNDTVAQRVERSGDTIIVYARFLCEQQSNLLYGDVDGDGKVSAADALEVLKSVVGKVTLDETQFAAADTDGSGKADAADALNILKKVVGKIDKFPVEQ